MLASRFGWHPLDVEDVLSRRQRPKVDVYADEPRRRLPLRRPPLPRLRQGRRPAQRRRARRLPRPGLPRDAADRRAAAGDAPLPRAPTRARSSGSNLFSRGSGRLLYEVLDDLYDYCFPILDKIGFKLEQIDEEIGEAGQRAKELVRDIHKVKQEIISYRKIIKPQRPTLRQLERRSSGSCREDLELYFDDIVDASERIWDLLDNYKEVVEALEATNESLISHQQNDILYVLTIFIVVLTPLTFITGFFGMNVHFPGFNGVAAFFASLGAHARRRSSACSASSAGSGGCDEGGAPMSDGRAVHAARAAPLARRRRRRSATPPASGSAASTT